MTNLLGDLIDPARTAGRVFYAVILLVAAVVAARLVRLWSRQLSKQHTLSIDQTSATFIAQLVQVLCFLVAVTVYAHLVPGLHRLATGLLASAGFISLVIGLAAQNTLGHLIAGIALLFYRPFSVGDILTVNTGTGREEGTVIAFTLGYTRLATADGRSIVIPNSVMISMVVLLAPPRPEA
jgi:small conductance mechanosensitive channel